MVKRRYRAVWVKDADVTALIEKLGEGQICVAIDVAKVDMFAAFVAGDGAVVATLKWKHPVATREFIALVNTVAKGVSVEIAMEPSGTYGDALRNALERNGFRAYRVNPKHTSDAKEIYDGVPSIHDAKSAAIIAKLHRDGRSEPWPIKSERERTLTAALRILEIHGKQFQQSRNRLANLLAKYWPELTKHFALDSATLLDLLMAYGSPAAVADDADGARAFMRRVGGHFLSPEKVDAVVASTAVTLGVPMVNEERRMMVHIAGEARRNQKTANKARQRVEELSMSGGTTQSLAPVVGKATSAVLVAAVGDPCKFGSAAAYEKALGLNLKEKSSGQHKGALHITKRGPGVARLYLWMAALRLIAKDPVVRAWYAKKVRRQGGLYKSKAVVAVMRKLVKALWHVAKGEKAFDPTLLFDTSRLDFSPAALEVQ